MKVTLVVLGFACFVGALYALPLDEESEEFPLEPQVLPNFEEDLVPETFPDAEVEPENEWSVAVSTTRRPRPPQVHHNAVRSQGPFSGRLVNVVLNRRGDQKTVQKNRIEYNLNAVKRALEALWEEQ